MIEKSLSLEEAKKIFVHIKVHAPVLDKNMKPDFRLINMKCPVNNNGHCNVCEKFRGYEPNKEGIMWCNMSFTGFCDCKEEKEFQQETALSLGNIE